MIYIEREALIEIAEQQGHVSFDDIINEPAADVAPVRRGRWLYEPKFGSTRPYHCSLPDCGASYPGKFLYCPNCSAEMD